MNFGQNPTPPYYVTRLNLWPTSLQDGMLVCRAPHISVNPVNIPKFQDSDAETRRVYVHIRLLAHPCRHRGPKTPVFGTTRWVSNTGLGNWVNRGHSAAASATRLYVYRTNLSTSMERSTGSERHKADLYMNVAGAVFGVLAPLEPVCVHVMLAVGCGWQPGHA